jgi:transposase
MRKDNKNYFSETDIYVGLDVHKKSWDVSIYVENIHFKSFSISPPSSKVLVEFLEKNFIGGRYHVVYEAGFSGFWIYDELTERAIDCVIVSPADIPMSNKNKNFKTDRNDSKQLAQKLKAGLLEGIHIPEKVQREHRALLRLRNKFVKDRTRIKNYIKSNLMFFGKVIGKDYEDTRSWSKRFVESLSGIKYLSEEGKDIITELLKMLCFYNEALKRVEKKINQLSLKQQYKQDVEILCSVPGISTLSAMIILIEIGDFNRFVDTNKLKSYVGLIPQEHSSGEKEIKTGITKRGNKFLKKIIVEVSWVAIRKDKTLLSRYTRLTKRMKGSKAVIVIAGILLNRIRSIMRKHEYYKIAA